MMILIFLVFTLFPIDIASDNAIYYLQEKSIPGGTWTDARGNCMNHMAFINRTFPLSRLNSCLNGTTSVYIGNVKLISPPLTLLGCFPIEGEYDDLMNTSYTMPRAAVAFCNYRCADSGGKFAIQGRKCRCFYNDYKMPEYNTNDFGNTSLCIPCEDNIEDICGGEYSAAFYTKSTLQAHFNENNYEDVCITKETFLNSDSGWSYASCTKKNGRCGNGQTFSNGSWIDITLLCATCNNSYLADNAENGNIINTRRYRIDVPESLFLPGFPVDLHDRKDDKALFGYVYKGSDGLLKLHFTPGGNLANHSLCLKNMCISVFTSNCGRKCEIVRVISTNYQTKVTDTSTRASSKGQSVPVENGSKEYETTTDRDTLTTESVYTVHNPILSSRLFTPNTLFNNTYTKDPTSQGKKNKQMTVVTMRNSSSSGISTSQNKVEGDRQRSKLLIVYITVPISVVVISGIAVGIIIWRRKSKPKGMESSRHPGVKPNDVEKDTEFALATAAGNNSTPVVYAVVNKPKKEQLTSQDTLDSLKSESNGQGQGEDYYVSNDDEYDQLRTKRKRNHTNSDDNEYNIAETGTFDENMYSLAKSIDANGQEDGTYDVALNVNIALENVPDDCMYDHSTPL